jgi:hypothetical protein
MTDNNVKTYTTNTERITAQSDYDAAVLRYNAAYAAGQAIVADVEEHATKDWDTLTDEERE